MFTLSTVFTLTSQTDTKISWLLLPSPRVSEYWQYDLRMIGGKTMNKWIHLVSWALKSHTHFAFSTSHNLTVSSSPATARMEFWKISGGCFYRYAYPSYENASSWGDPLLENWQQHLMLCLCDSTSENVAFTLCQNCSQNLAFGYVVVSELTFKKLTEAILLGFATVPVTVAVSSS